MKSGLEEALEDMTSEEQEDFLNWFLECLESTDEYEEEEEPF